MCSKSSRKSQKLSPLAKVVNYLPSVSSPLSIRGALYNLFVLLLFFMGFSITSKSLSVTLCQCLDVARSSKLTSVVLPLRKMMPQKQ